jgi:hypothetical protein
MMNAELNQRSEFLDLLDDTAARDVGPYSRALSESA